MSLIILQLTDRLTDISINHRYDTNRYLEIYHEALQVVHPQHEIMCEIAKWLVPIMCRTVPGAITLNDYPEHDITLKKNLCFNYLNVMKKVKPGLSRMLGTNFINDLHYLNQIRHITN